MEEDSADKIEQTGMYPDPSAQNAGAPSFPYGNPQQQPQPGNPQVSQAPTAPMHRGSNIGDQMQDSMHAYYTPQRLAQQGLNVNQSNGLSSEEGLKKKQKASRACDECRRKKIKCDAESEEPGVRCSACSRSELNCQFSRAPQKRGPSKGYIKELAERVNLLERVSGGTPYQSSPHGLSQSDFNAYSSSPDFTGSDTRKRTHSMAEGSQAFASGAEQLRSYTKGYTPNMSSSNAPSTYHGPPDPTQSLSELGSLSGEPIDDYIREMHTYLPILPNSKDGLQSWLDRARKPVRDALLRAIAAAMNTATTNADSRTLEGSAARLSKLQIESVKGRTTLENIMFLQALLFMILAEESSGAGRNESVLWYGVAFGVASFLKLYCSDGPNPGDSPEVLELKTNGRRAYLVLAMLERWRAASMLQPSSVSDHFVRLHPSDHQLLGESAYHLIRLSLPLGHLTEILLRRKVQPTDGPLDPLLIRALKGEIERIREGIELSFPALRHVQLAYLHIKLLADRHLEEGASNTKSIIEGAFAIIDLIATEQNRASPLTHHFAALATITLAEVIEYDEQPIGNALKHLQNDLDNGHVQYPYGVSGSRPAWSTAISAFISKKSGMASNHGGLQHLADAAVGGGTNIAEEVGKKLEHLTIDWTAMTLEGYLKLFE